VSHGGLADGRHRIVVEPVGQTLRVNEVHEAVVLAPIRVDLRGGVELLGDLIARGDARDAIGAIEESGPWAMRATVDLLAGMPSASGTSVGSCPTTARCRRVAGGMGEAGQSRAVAEQPPQQRDRLGT
jgi:hypothetical protein